MNNIAEKILEDSCFSANEENNYRKYLNLLVTENKKYNLTRIESEEEMWYRHILDSTKIAKFKLLDKSETILDIGSGCGVPGIVLAIKYPEKKFLLMEVNNKKIHFLKLAVDFLQIKNIDIITSDFLTYIHHPLQIPDTFLARASLGLKDIVKIYLYNYYKKSSIVYWAGPSWKNDKKHNVILKNTQLSIQEFFYNLPSSDASIEKKLSYVFIKKN